MEFILPVQHVLLLFTRGQGLTRRLPISVWSGHMALHAGLSLVAAFFSPRARSATETTRRCLLTLQALLYSMDGMIGRVCDSVRTGV